MAYKFNINRGNAILNFSEEFCHTRLELIESEGFSRVTKAFIDHIQELDNNIYNYLCECNDSNVGIANDLKMIAKLLLVMNVEEICDVYDNYRAYFRDREMFVKVVEDVYNVMPLYLMLECKLVSKMFNLLMLKINLKNSFYLLIVQLKKQLWVIKIKFIVKSQLGSMLL